MTHEPLIPFGKKKQNKTLFMYKIFGFITWFIIMNPKHINLGLFRLFHKKLQNYS